MSEEKKEGRGSATRRTADLTALRSRNIVLVGMMGAGKTTVGRRLAAQLDLPFVDSDNEIELAAGMSISEIFEAHGEEHFRYGERRVLERLLAEGPQVISTGGGAYINAEVRGLINQASYSVWLTADFDVLFERVSRRKNRPLLQTENPRQVLKDLVDERTPIYSTADVSIVSRNVPHDIVAGEIIDELIKYIASHKGQTDEN